MNLAVQNNLVFAHVTFDVQSILSLIAPMPKAGSKLYTYKYRGDIGPTDYCVVLVSGEPKIVQVVSVDKHGPVDAKFKWIAAVLDKQMFFDYNNRVEREAQLAEEMAELKRLANERAHKKAFLSAFAGEPDLLARLEAVMQQQAEL